jgi:ubiquitin-like 1-activating enzyme E1 B
MYSTQRLSDTLAKIRATTTGVDAALSFDKDDEDNLDFVASSANLRSSIFDIAMKSKFDIKRTPSQTCAIKKC